LDVVQFFNNAGYVSDTVAIAIEKGPRIDMINGGFFPPFGVLQGKIRTIDRHILHISAGNRFGKEAEVQFRSAGHVKKLESLLQGWICKAVGKLSLGNKPSLSEIEDTLPPA
jgi:hypothetical protein